MLGALTMSQVSRYWPGGRGGMNGDEFSKEFSVPEGRMVGAINLDEILVKLTDFHDNTCFVPFQGEPPGLVLYPNVVAYT